MIYFPNCWKYSQQTASAMSLVHASAEDSHIAQGDTSFPE